MALQVWLPLNGDLRNQGLDGHTKIINNGTIINDNGKIGKCYSFGTKKSYLTLSKECMINFYECSISFWVKFLTWNTNYATVFQAGLGSIPWDNYIFGILRNNNTSTFCFTIGNGSSATNANYLTPSLNLNEWYHLTFTYSTGHCKIYMNGQLTTDFSTTIVPNFANISYITIGAANNGTSYQTNMLLNDFRIYDHALSLREVKELAKGLILHYRLSKPMPNLLKNGAFTSLTTGNTGLGTGIYATSWGGYNNGISNPTTNYHACIDQDTFGYPVYMYNETNGSRNWKGISQNISKNLIEGSTDYIFSCDIYQTLSGGKIFGGFYYKKTGATSASFASGQYKISASMIPKGSWTKISIKVPFNDNIDSSVSSVSFYIYGYGFSDNGIVYIKNVKLEKGTKATTFIPNESDPLYAAAGYASGIVYDCSGYQNNGTEVGTITGSSDTPRYRSSSVFNVNTDTITPKAVWENGVIIPQMSVSIWFKTNTLNSTAPNLWSLGENSFARIRIASATSIWYYIKVASTNVYGIYTTKTLTDNVWHHVVFTFNNGVVTMYIDGVQVGTTDHSSTGTSLTMSSTFWHLAGYEASSESFLGSLSDFRVYATALSAADVKALYTDAGYVDKNGNFHAYEFVEI